MKIDITDLGSVLGGILEAQEEIKAQLQALAARVSAGEVLASSTTAQISACHGELASQVKNAYEYCSRLDRENARSHNDTRLRVVQLEKAVKSMPDLSGAMVELSASVEAVEVRLARVGRAFLGEFEVPTPTHKQAPQPKEFMLGGDVFNPAKPD